jgi:sucrose phosphorylase
VKKQAKLFFSLELIQMFMPGIPNLVFRYFVEKNHQADNGGSAGHKEINRTTLSMRDIEQTKRQIL